VVRWPLQLGALALYVGVVLARGGPPPTSVDTYSVVRPTVSLSEGDLAAAARQSVYPQPPGYPLLASPFVAALRPLIGSPTWCSDKPLPAVIAYLQHPCTGPDVGRRAPPPWYRSQAVLGILAWAVLAGGSVSLVRAAGSGGGLLEVGVVVVLAAVPSASDAMVETFHPQDLVCVGLLAAGLALSLRRRWALAGVAFGVAFLCKQFAVLPLLAVLVAAPDWRRRARVAASFSLVVAAGVIPFLVGDATQTARDLTDTLGASQGYEITGTVVGLARMAGATKLAVSRDAPLVVSLFMALVARWRCGRRLLDPGPLIGLALACLATRLVFEVNLTSYYLLAVSTVLVVLDVAHRRLPLRSFAWVGLSGAWVAGSGATSSLGRQAAVLLAFSLAAVGLGLAELWAPPAVPARPTARVQGV
jgi:hypothetical protein